MWLKGEYCISPPIIFVWSWYLMVVAFPSYLFSFVSFCTRSLMLIECHASAWNYFSHLVFSVCLSLCTWITAVLSLPPSYHWLLWLSKNSFMQALLYISYSLSACLFVNQSGMKPAACLSVFSLPVSSSEHIYLTFSVSCLKSTQLTIYSGTASLICHSKSSFMFCNSCMHTHTHILSHILPFAIH